MKKGHSIFLCLVALVTYWKTVSNGYNLDDELVTKNHPLTNPKTESNLATIFSSPYQSEGGLKSGFRPVTVASFYFEHQLFGESAKGSHTVNLLLFLAIVLLLHQLLALIFRETNPYILLFIALLFSLHPIHSEVVASIKNRDELLSLVFFIISAICAIKWLSKGNPIYLASTVLFVVLSILSKKSALPIIALFPILLLFTQKLKVSQYLKIGLAFSIPIGFFAFNLQLIPGLVTFLALNVFYFSAFYIPKYWEKKSFPDFNLFEFFILGCIFLFVAIGVYYHQLILLIVGQLLLVTIVKKHFKVVLLFSTVISLLGYFTFYNAEFLVFLIMLVSSRALVNKQTIKFNPKLLIGLLPLLLLIAYRKQDYLQILIYLSPLLIFLTVLVHRYIPIVISLIAIVVSLYFNVVGYFQIGILLFSILALSKWELLKLEKMYVGAWLCIAFLFVGVKYMDQQSKFYFNSDVNQTVEISFNQKLREGRRLEFVENTLVAQHSLEERFATGLIVMGTYLKIMVFPKELSFYYGYAKIDTTNFKDYRVWLSLLGYFTLLFCIGYFYKKQPLIAIGCAWFVGCIFLFSNFPVLVAGMLGERLAFTASLGFCIFVGGLLNWLKPNLNFKKPRAIEIIVLGLLVVLGNRTVARNSEWESHIKLMSNDIQHLENSAQANYLLAVHLIKEAEQSAKGGPVDMQKVNTSIGYFKKAIKIYPKHYNFHIDLGKAYLVAEQSELAKQSFLRADRLESNALYGLFELAKVCFTLKEYTEVINYSTLYVEQSKSNPTVYELAAFSAYYADDYSLALRYTKEGLRQFPNNQALKQILPDLQRRIVK